MSWQDLYTVLTLKIVLLNHCPSPTGKHSTYFKQSTRGARKQLHFKLPQRSFLLKTTVSSMPFSPWEDGEGGGRDTQGYQNYISQKRNSRLLAVTHVLNCSPRKRHSTATPGMHSGSVPCGGKRTVARGMLGSGTGPFPRLAAGLSERILETTVPSGLCAEGGQFFCRKSALALGPPTAARARAAQEPRDRGRWGPDGGRHGNGGAPTLGPGGGWVHVQVLEARSGTDKPPLPRCDGLGRARALRIGADWRPGKGAAGW